MHNHKNIEAMRVGFGDHEKWINVYKKGFAWNSLDKIWTVVSKYMQHYNSVLEIAIGYGRFTEKIIPYSEIFYGIDLNQCCVDHCSKTFDKGTFMVCDGLSIPIKDNYFDIILCLDSMVHFSLDIIESYLNESINLLKDDGKIIFHHASSGESVGYRSKVYDSDIDDLISKYKVKLIDRHPLWWLSDKNCFNDSISVISKI